MVPDAMTPALPDVRLLGRTGAQVLAVSLGGEGILRTTGRAREAVPVILEALRLGVRYCDTAPAYQQSQDYYGEAFRRPAPARATACFWRRRPTSARAIGRCACSTIRCDGSAPIGSTCGRCTIFERPASWTFCSGRTARSRRRARRRPTAASGSSGSPATTTPTFSSKRCAGFPSTACCSPVNPADPRHRPFTPTVLAEARRQGMGVVGMKVMAAGPLLDEARPDELIRYSASLADTVIIGCSTIAEVRENLAVARALRADVRRAERRALEQRIAPHAADYDTFKR